MMISQLLMYVALTAGILLYAALAIVPLLVEHEARKADREQVTPTTGPRPTSLRTTTRQPGGALHHLPHAA